MIPIQPATLFPRPFADNGTFEVIPDEKTGEGRASFREGFPVETQLPLSNGGIAPSRMDFNGIFHMLSAFSFWQQSGGQWTWSSALSYQKPNMVFHDNIMWWCVQASGPATVDGPKIPGTDENYWVDILTMVKDMGEQNGNSGMGGTPVGGIIMWPSIDVPEGFFECKGQVYSAAEFPKLYSVLGSSIIPDMRGLFVRGYDPEGTNDANGKDRAIRTTQGDAIRNIYGSWGGKGRGSTPTPTGAVYTTVYSGSSHDDKGSVPSSFAFDASRVVPTAAENRPKNINMLYIIKHD